MSIGVKVVARTSLPLFLSPDKLRHQETDAQVFGGMGPQELLHERGLSRSGNPSDEELSALVQPIPQVIHQPLSVHVLPIS